METRLLSAGPDGILAAVDLLRRGHLVAFPTETVYGLGADARDATATAGIYEAKGRPSFNPLIAHVADLNAARCEGEFDDGALRLAEAFWPGPLTLVVPTAPSCTVSALARAGLDSVALRVPAHRVAAEILQRAAFPVAAPSANRSGRISPTSAAHVVADLDSRIDAVVDGGSTVVGLESTIVACLDGRYELLRPGAVTRDAIASVLHQPLAEPEAGTHTLRAPGMLASHYAPRAAVRLDATDVKPDESALDFGGRLRASPCCLQLDLSPTGNLREAAANLFDYLHRLDGAGTTHIAVAPIPFEGLGEAINDRLRRAAAPRR